MAHLIEFEGKHPVIGANVFLAPTATLIGDVVVGDNTSIWFGAVLRGDFGAIRIGANCSIQDNVVVHADSEAATIIGDNVTLGHGACVEGCTIGNHSLVGSGAVVLIWATLGERSVVAANSVVLEKADIPPMTLAAGAPAKVKKALEGRALDWTEFAPRDYVRMQARYRAQGIDKLQP
jgi:carbonic anhydrase/acetyltransferase-like protein (isoleucine patch superfamily)